MDTPPRGSVIRGSNSNSKDCGEGDELCEHIRALRPEETLVLVWGDDSTSSEELPTVGQRPVCFYIRIVVPLWLQSPKAVDTQKEVQ